MDLDEFTDAVRGIVEVGYVRGHVLLERILFVHHRIGILPNR